MSATNGNAYRVRWRREGTEHQKSYTAVRHFETLAAAERCVNRQETARDDIAEWFRDGEDGHTDWSRVPRPLIWGPVIERRPVGKWEPVSPEPGPPVDLMARLRESFSNLPRASSTPPEAAPE